MIYLDETGTYELVETKRHIKILCLSGAIYAWLEPKDIGEILILSKRNHTVNCILSIGHYRLYRVTNEPGLVDLAHLELEVGNDTWQSYLLLTGLPTKHKKRSRIIPTNELITHNPTYLGFNPTPRHRKLLSERTSV